LRALYEAVGVTTDLTIATHCQTGVRGSHSFFVLRLLGYANLELYDAGWEEWGNDPDVPIEPDVAPAAEPEPDDGSGMDGDM
jgi:thiosulfate/3-mercaptopyruvate sulfurtransferase